MNRLLAATYRTTAANLPVANRARDLAIWAIDNSRTLLRRRVSMDRLLVGGENALPGPKYARLTGRLLRCSTSLADSPHVDFLKQYGDFGERIFEPDFFERTRYYRNAAEAIDLCGYYFSARHPSEIVQVAKEFVSHLAGRARTESAGRSRRSSPVVVRRIAHSGGCYEIVDGHHRLAIALVKGDKEYPAYVLWDEPVTTPLQDKLMDCLWTRGERIRYQPLDYPELAKDWPLVRSCRDRLRMMRDWFAQMPPSNGRRSYIDIGSSYGWFVSRMAAEGFDAFGVERDTAAIDVGVAAYGVRPEQIKKTEIVNFCEAETGEFDFVSCFSVLHHFVLGKARISAEEFMRHLDRITRKALFFDTGQSHEQWFRHSLAGWNDDFIIDWIKRHSTFASVTKIGVDEDDRGRFRGNYGRSMFVCART